MCVRLSASNRLDEDVVAAHFGHSDHRTRFLLLGKARAVLVRVEEAELTEFRVAHDKHFRVRLLVEALVELFERGLLLNRRWLLGASMVLLLVLVDRSGLLVGLRGAGRARCMALIPSEEHLVRL